jgi:hypothetical protein
MIAVVRPSLYVRASATEKISLYVNEMGTEGSRPGPRYFCNKHYCVIIIAFQSASAELRKPHLQDFQQPMKLNTPLPQSLVNFAMPCVFNPFADQFCYDVSRKSVQRLPRYVGLRVPPVTIVS